MSVEHLEIFVEEPSMEAALEVLLPRILGERPSFAIYNMGSKQQLLARLPDRLRGYSNWLPDGWRVVVLVDRDRDDCLELKRALEVAAAAAGFPTTANTATDGGWRVANRIVIEELEAWYFGDLGAIRTAYPKLPRNLEAVAKYRDPDAIADTWEALERELQRRGYFRAGLAKIELARAVAPLMVPERNRSRSFQVFHETLRRCIQNPP
jgi:hypothetical protein